MPALDEANTVPQERYWHGYCFLVAGVARTLEGGIELRLFFLIVTILGSLNASAGLPWMGNGYKRKVLKNLGLIVSEDNSVVLYEVSKSQDGEVTFKPKRVKLDDIRITKGAPIITSKDHRTLFALNNASNFSRTITDNYNELLDLSKEGKVVISKESAHEAWEETQKRKRLKRVVHSGLGMDVLYDTIFVVDSNQSDFTLKCYLHQTEFVHGTLYCNKDGGRRKISLLSKSVATQKNGLIGSLNSKEKEIRPIKKIRVEASSGLQIQEDTPFKVVERPLVAKSEPPLQRLEVKVKSSSDDSKMDVGRARHFSTSLSKFKGKFTLGSHTIEIGTDQISISDSQGKVKTLYVGNDEVNHRVLLYRDTEMKRSVGDLSCSLEGQSTRGCDLSLSIVESNDGPLRKARVSLAIDPNREVLEIRKYQLNTLFSALNMSAETLSTEDRLHKVRFRKSHDSSEFNPALVNTSMAGAR